MKKFFKIFGYIALTIFVIAIIFGIYLYFWNENRIEKSKKLSQRIESFQSQDSNEYMEYSVDFNKAGDFENGFKYLNKAVELEPEMHLGYRGWIRLRKLRDFDKALADFERLDSLTPNFVDAPWNENIDFLRGECYFGKKDYKKAIESFNLNVKNNKEDWVDIHTFVYLGLCEYELGNYEKAISEFERALAQSKYTTESFFGISKAFYKLGNIEKAKENILEAEKNIDYKRNDIYNEFLNEIYLSEILEFKKLLFK